MDASHAKWLRSVLGLHTGYLVIVQYVVPEHLSLHCSCVPKLQFFLLCDPADLGLYGSSRCRSLSVKTCSVLFLLFWKHAHNTTVRYQNNHRCTAEVFVHLVVKITMIRSYTQFLRCCNFEESWSC